MGSLRTEWLHFHFSLSCTGEGNGNPLQCSCLENPKDGGAWWAAVYGVAQSRTRLKQLSSSSSSREILLCILKYFPCLWSYLSLPSMLNFVKSVVEITLGNLIQPLYLVSSKTEGVAPITYLISKDILTLILYSTSVNNRWHWIFMWKPKTKQQNSLIFY